MSLLLTRFMLVGLLFGLVLSCSDPLPTAVQLIVANPSGQCDIEQKGALLSRAGIQSNLIRMTVVKRSEGMLPELVCDGQSVT